MWFICPSPRPEAKQRIFCFPYSGGSANNFRSWAHYFPESIELMIVRLPGRDSRLKEKPFSEWTQLLETLELALLPLLDKPYFFFGHSFGGRIIYELTKVFQKKQRPLPSCLFISGCRAPHIPTELPFLHELPKKDFIERLRRMKGTHADILANTTLFDLLEPAIREDIRLSELWEDIPKKQLQTPIVALSGIDDPMDPPSKMDSWALYTTALFSLYQFKGEHFFLHTHEKEVLNLILKSCHQLTTFSSIIKLNATAFFYPTHLTISALFEKQVKHSQKKIAVVCKNKSLTYEQLNQRSNQLAHYLVRKGIKPGDIVAVNIARSPEMIIAFLAILKTGSAYLPLDTYYPKERLTYMLEDANVVMLINKDLLEKEQCDIEKESIENLKQYIVSTDMAYINYTSGSTGQPKGVVVPHKAVIRLVYTPNYIDVNENSVFLQMAPVSFDAATFEIWGALLNTAQCVLFDQKLQTIQALSRYLNDFSINVLFLTTALFNVIIDENPAILSGVKQLLTGGEAHSMKHIKKAWETLPNTQITSVYGPTESTTFASYYPIKHCPLSSCFSLPIGRPINNTQMYILDEHHQLLPIGEIGELYLGGDGLALGYLNREDLTAQKFIKNVSFLPPDVCLYKTGDRARYLDGNIEFLGRLDNQVKLNGFRIDLGEIEFFLCAHEKIKQAVVLADKSAYDQQKLLAFLVVKSEISANEIRDYLQKKLPVYMIPSYYYFLERFPLSLNGKIDKQQLFNQL